MFYLEEDEKDKIVNEINLENMIKASVLDSLLTNEIFQLKNPDLCQGIKETVDNLLLQYLPVDSILQ